MAFDNDQIHVFGSDDDKVWVAPLGATAPTDLSDPSGPFEHVGFLGEDGLTLTPEDTVERFRVHQGGKVVKTKMTQSDTGFSFIAVQDNPLTAGMQYSILDTDTTGGVTTQTLDSSRRVESRAFIIDLFDVYHYRYVIPRGELGERQEVSWSNSALSAYSYQVQIIGDWYRITDDPAFAESSGGGGGGGD